MVTSAAHAGLIASSANQSGPSVPCFTSAGPTASGPPSCATIRCCCL